MIKESELNFKNIL